MVLRAQAGEQAPQPRAAAAAALRGPEFLRALLAAREGRLLSLLGAALAAGGPHPSKEAQFDTWMKQQSDLVQASAVDADRPSFQHSAASNAKGTAAGPPIGFGIRGPQCTVTTHDRAPSGA